MDINYYSVWKQFNEFFVQLDRKPTRWEDRIALFLTHLFDTGKIQSKTIRSYSSVLRSVLKAEDIHIDKDSYSSSALVKVCKLQNDVLNIRLPIQKNLLTSLLDRVDEYYNKKEQVHLTTMYKAIILTGYYGLL